MIDVLFTMSHVPNVGGKIGYTEFNLCVRNYKSSFFF